MIKIQTINILLYSYCKLWSTWCNIVVYSNEVT